MSDAVRLSPPQIPALTEVLVRAFMGYPLMQYVAPDPAVRFSANRTLYGAIIRDTLRHGEVWTTGDLAGAACWLPPERAFPTFWRQAAAGMWQLAFRARPVGLARLMAYDALGQSLHHRHAAMPHWYLSVIGIHPDRQGQGLAGQLLRPLLDRADRAGIPTYLETHHDVNVPLYEHFGYRLMELATLPGRPVSVWAMHRSVGGR